MLAQKKITFNAKKVLRFTKKWFRLSPVQRQFSDSNQLKTTTTMKNLIYSSNKVSYDQLKEVEKPEPMGSRHFPIDHHELVDIAKRELEHSGFDIVQEEHGLAEKGMNCFSGFAIRKSDFDNTDRELVFGLRNSHNQKFASSVAVGSSMLVCENLCFSSDITLSRKHTRNIFQDLPLVMAEAIGSIQKTWDNEGKRIETYKNTEADEVEVINKLLKAGLIKPTKIEKFLDLVQNGGVDVDGTKGAFHEHRGTLWNIFNAVTESYKDLTANNVMHLPRMTMQTQGILDRIANPSLITEEDKAIALPA